MVACRHAPCANSACSGCWAKRIVSNKSNVAADGTCNANRAAARICKGFFRGHCSARSCTGYRERRSRACEANGAPIDRFRAVFLRVRWNKTAPSGAPERFPATTGETRRKGRARWRSAAGSTRRRGRRRGVRGRGVDSFCMMSRRLGARIAPPDGGRQKMNSHVRHHDAARLPPMAVRHGSN